MSNQLLHNYEAESAVLGAMLLEREAAARACELLRSEDFARPLHRTLFGEIAVLHKQGKPVDPIVLEDELRRKEKLEECGGTAYMMGLLEAAPTAGAVAYYADIVRDYAGRRQLQNFLQRMAKRVNNTEIRPQEIAAGLQRAGAVLAKNRLVMKADEPPPVRYADLISQEAPPIEWLVDKLIPTGAISILSGDAGVGKTWALLHLAQCVASGRPLFDHFACPRGAVLWWDEEGSEMLLRRRLCKLHQGLALAEDALPVEFLICQGWRLDDETSLQKLSQALEKQRPALVIVDSLTRVHNSDENNASEMARLFAQVKRLAAEFGAAFLFTHHSRKLSQVSNRAGQRLRGSTDLRAVVDVHIYMSAPAAGKLHFEHDKARYAEAHPPFAVDMTDLDDGAVLLQFDKELDLESEKTDKTRQDILAALTDAGGKLDRATLLERMKGIKISRAVMDRAIRELSDNSQIAKERVGHRISYCLAD